LIPKHVVSISLGTSKRDKRSEVELLGQPFLIERRGTDGNFAEFERLFHELDGKVDAMGVGGADVYVVVDDRSYPWRQIERVAQSVTRTPVVDGSGLKHTLERDTIEQLQRDGIVNFKGAKVLLVSGVDRFGMAQALEAAGAIVTYGDLMFGLGVPIPLKGYAKVRRLAKIILPILTRLPQTWVYPIGAQQEKRKPQFESAFADADIIAGDWHLIRKALPDKIVGKTILTQTVRQADLDMLREMGAARVIVTTPIIGGETFATNVMEACIVAALANRDNNDSKPAPLTETQYREALKALGWKPGIINL
jgi:hypothetical protein